MTPNSSPPTPSPRSSPVAVFLTAVQFLLVSPAFIKRPFTPEELGRATGYYPLVGGVLATILILVDWGLGLLLPMGARSALLLATWVLLTGSLHLDGFLDTCDGLFGGYTPEQRLTIMRDERIGAYALAGGVLLLLTQYSALSNLGELRWAALVLAPVMSRWGMTMAVVFFPYARSQGLGKHIKDHASWRVALGASLTVLLVAICSSWYFHSWVAAIAWAAAALVVWQGGRFILRRIPGFTGDVYGALNVTIEATILLICVVLEGWSM
jgi:adenosylcobinamide-GDP ribazoletransferase